MQIYTDTIGSNFQAVDDAVERIIHAIRDKKIIRNKHLIFDVNFVLREILNNAVEHGNHFDVNKMVKIQIDFLKPMLSIKVIDEGSGFDLEKILAYTGEEHILRQRHRGFQTIRELGFCLKSNKNQMIVTINIEEAEHEKSKQ